MTDESTATEGTGGTVFDDPNREAVGLDPAWVEGTGGTPDEVTPVEADEPADGGGSDLDQMTKDQLLEHAQQLGVSPANASMTKDELRAGIDAHQAA
jgi:hypothetical protein